MFEESRQTLLVAFLPNYFLRRGAYMIKGHLTVSGVLILIAIGMFGWVVAGRGLRGGRLALWLLVPVLTLFASLCVAGPGRLFPKEPYEGREVIPIGPHDAVMTSDIVGISIVILAGLLAGFLIWLRTHRATCH